MTTALAVNEPAGFLAMLDQLPEAAASMGDDLGLQGLGPRLKYDSRVGLYTLNGEIIPAGTEAVFNFFQTKLSKICWVDGKPVERHEKSAFDKTPLPLDKDLTDHGPYKDMEGWSTSITFMVLFPHNGVQATFGISSWGGRAAAEALFKSWAVEQRMQIDDAGVPLNPLVSLNVGPKRTTAYGQMANPVFKIEAWISNEELAQEIGGVAPPAPVEAPKVVRPAARAAAAPAAAAPAAATPARAGGLGSGLRGKRA